MSFTDFKNGLQIASDYLDNKNHIIETQADGTYGFR